jgi:hypothetical protein
VEQSFSPSPELKGKIFFGSVLPWKLIRVPDSSINSKYGVAGASDWDTFNIEKFSAKNAFACSP